MPRATVNTTAEQHELKSLDGAFVKLKRMSYGQWVHRQDIAMDMEMTGSGKNDAKSTINMTQQRVAIWEFEHCIVEHNLEDEAGQLLVFGNPNTINILNPIVGNEISKLISELHEFDLGN